MKLDGQYKIPASTEKVWAALNDPEILQQAIPGAESVEKVGEDKFRAVVKAKIGPVSARFTGEITLKDKNPPHGCRIVGEGKGGVAGFAKGQAVVKLQAEEDGTTLSYEADAAIGGKLAQIGQRIIKAAAGKMAAQFFGAFSRLLDENAAPEDAYISDSVLISPAIQRILLVAAGLGLAGLMVWSFFQLM